MTEITFDGKKVVKMEVHGQEFVWFRFHFEDGSHFDTFTMKGEL